MVSSTTSSRTRCPAESRACCNAALGNRTPCELPILTTFASIQTSTQRCNYIVIILATAGKAFGTERDHPIGVQVDQSVVLVPHFAHQFVSRYFGLWQGCA